MMNLTAKLKEVIKNYCISIDEVNEKYYIAINFLTQLEEKAFKNDMVLEKYFKYLSYGSTINLKHLLYYHTSYNEDSLLEFRAFCIIYSCYLQMKRLQAS